MWIKFSRSLEITGAEYASEANCSAMEPEVFSRERS